MDTFRFENVRGAPSPSQQPIVQPAAWRAARSVAGDRHLLLILAYGPMRATSPIVRIEGVHAITFSGRRYCLDKPPTETPLLLAMLRASADRLGLGTVADISDALWAELSRSAGGDEPEHGKSTGGPQ